MIDNIQEIIKNIANNPTAQILISILIGSVLPTFISVFLPRRKTIGFGRIIYKFLGGAFLQKRATHLKISEGIWGNLMLMIRSTFTDLSFGVYIESREDFTDEQKDQKTEEYINLHKTTSNNANQGDTNG